MKVVLITGSRHGGDVLEIWGRLRTEDPDMVIEGGATGADHVARDWAEEVGCAFLHWPDEHWGGKVPGPIRNGLMVQTAVALLNAGWTVLLLAYPESGSRGTWDCVRQAKRAGIEGWWFDIGTREYRDI